MTSAANNSSKKTPAAKANTEENLQDKQPAAEQNKKPVAKTTSPKPAKPTVSKQEVTTPNFKQKTSKIGVLAFLLALITAGGVGGLAWLGYQQLESINQQLAATVNEEKITQAVSGLAKQIEVNEQQGQLISQLNQLEEDLTDQLVNQLTSLESLTQEVAALNLPQLNLRQLTEIEFLLQRAEVYSQQLNDPQAAIQLVELAIASVKELNLSHKNKLLAELNTSLNELSQVNPSNRLAIARQLYDLAATTSSLNSFHPAIPQNSTAETLENLPWYKQAWQEVQSLLVIQHLDEKLEVLPFSPQEEAIKHQLNALLLQAATAANLSQQKVYDFCLAAAEEKLAVFIKASQAAKNLAEQLSQLKEVELKPQLPSLQPSLNELAKLQASVNYQPED